MSHLTSVTVQHIQLSICQVKQLKMEFQQGSEPNLAIKGDTHTIGSLLKLYLRSLPDSIIPSILYEDFVSIILTYDINEREGINELKYLINKIPCSNYNTLRVSLLPSSIIS